MMRLSIRPPVIRNHRGFVLMASLLLLLIATIFSLAMFRRFGLEQRIGGNIREKQRAVQAAESALQYAEWWLTQPNNAFSYVGNCSGTLNANAGQGQVCLNGLSTLVTDIATVPWIASGSPIGTNYVPPGMTVAITPSTGTYYAAPVFYVSLVGSAPNGVGQVYQIDAVGYGGTADAVAVVESTYQVVPGIKNLALP